MEATSMNQVLVKLERNEKLAKRRAILLTFFPVVLAILLIIYTTQKVVHAQKELDTVEDRIRVANIKIVDTERKLDSFKILNTNLKIQNDSLKKSLIETSILLGKQVSVFNEFKIFIDKMKPFDRSSAQAAFWINYRMLEDRIRGNYADLARHVAGLPDLDTLKNWIVIVKSSSSLEDLKIEVAHLASIYGEDQIVIYKSGQDFYSLAVKGNGTFTRAYRLNVELRDKNGYPGAYFSGRDDWGSDYLKK